MTSDTPTTQKEPKKEEFMKVFVECPLCHARVEVVVSNSVLLLLLAQKLGVDAVHVERPIQPSIAS